MITTRHKIKESSLYEIWNEQKFLNDIFTVEGEKIEIFDKGEMNQEIGGPDFKNARIKIGNITYVGDVEIDCFHSDWKYHKHSINKKFNKVILHAVLKRDYHVAHVVTENGRKIPTVCFEDFIGKDFLEKLLLDIQKERGDNNNRLSCSDIIDLADPKTRLHFLYELGVKRLRQKCEKFILRLKELNYLKSLKIKEPDIRYDIPEDVLKGKIPLNELHDKGIWEQVFYEFLFEALGYTQNKDMMRKLAQTVNLEFLKSFKKQPNLLTIYESILFNIAGLLPDVQNLEEEHTSEYTRKLFEEWIRIRARYNGKIFNSDSWHFFRLRPQNFPTVRLAAGAELLYRIVYKDLIKTIVKKIKHINSSTTLLNCLRNLLVVKAEDYWASHYVFDKPIKKDIKYLLGSNRADEIVLNVIIPFAYVYFELFDKKFFSQKVLKIYTEIKCETENSIVKEMAALLKIDSHWQKAVIYQGLLELYRSFCSKHNCTGCRIGQVVYDESETLNEQKVET